MTNPKLSDREIEQHERFILESLQGFVELPGAFGALDSHIADASPELCAVTAGTGMGKSSLLAAWVDRLRRRLADEAMAGSEVARNTAVIARFVGKGEQSTHYAKLIHSVLLELSEHHGRLADTRLPEDDSELRDGVLTLLARAGAKGPVIVVLDALDQLQNSLDEVYWIPESLPENVKLIVSFKSDDEQGERLLTRWRSLGEVRLLEPPRFDALEARASLVTAALERHERLLDPAVVSALVAHEGARQPLFLKVVLHELRFAKTCSDMAHKIRTRFGTTSEEAFDAVLARMEAEANVGSFQSELIVPRIFGLLAHARSGLSLAELSEMIRSDLRLPETRREEIADSVERCLLPVRPFLARRQGRYDFFFAAFRAAARFRYALDSDEEPSVAQTARSRSPHARTACAWHSVLANQFEALPLFAGGADGWGLDDVPNARKVSELPYHLTLSRRFDDVERVLCDLWFVEAKVRAGAAFALEGDYARVLDALAANDERQYWQELARIEQALKAGESPAFPALRSQTEILAEDERISTRPTRIDGLRVFRNFVRGEGHRLEAHGRQPGFTVQTAYNAARSGPVAEQAARLAKESPWPMLLYPELHRPPFTAYPEVIRTLLCPHVFNASLLSYGRAVGRAENDAFVWDLQTGRIVRSLHLRDECYCADAIGDDNHVLVRSGGGSREIAWLWHVGTGKRRRVARDAVVSTGDVVFSSDPRFTLVEDDVARVLVCDLGSGAHRRVLEGCAPVLLPGDRHALTRAPPNERDKWIALWDVQSGVRQLKTSGDECRAFSDGDHFVVRNGGQIELWSARRRSLLRSLDGRAANGEGSMIWAAVKPPPRPLGPGPNSGVAAPLLDRRRGISIRWNSVTLSALDAAKPHRDYGAAASLYADHPPPTGPRGLGRLNVCLLDRGRKVLCWPIGAALGCSAVSLLDVASGASKILWQGVAQFVRCSVIAGSIVAEVDCIHGDERWCSETAIFVWDEHTAEPRGTAIAPPCRLLIQGGGHRALAICRHGLGVLELAPEVRFTLLGAPSAQELAAGTGLSISGALWERSPGKTATVLADQRRALLVCGHDVSLWDLETARQISALTLPFYCWGTVVDRAERRVLLNFAEHGTGVLNLESWQYESRIKVCAEKRGFLDGGSQAFTVTHGLIRTWDLATSRLIREIQSEHELRRCVVLAGKNRLLTLDAEGLLCVWDLGDGRCVHTRRVAAPGDAEAGDYTAPNRYVKHVHVFEDQRHAITYRASAYRGDASLHFWDLETGSCLGVADNLEHVTALSDDLLLGVNPLFPGAPVLCRVKGPWLAARSALSWHPTRLVCAALTDQELCLYEYHYDSSYAELVQTTLVGGVDLTRGIAWNRQGSQLRYFSAEGEPRIVSAFDATLEVGVVNEWTSASPISCDGRFRAELAHGTNLIVRLSS